jgi:hypothetical protein
MTIDLLTGQITVGQETLRSYMSSLNARYTLVKQRKVKVSLEHRTPM